MGPLVSILVPAYNAEEWISDALRSALAQTWSDKEIIVVDDGSTDATVTVAGRFESSLVKIVSQPNRGASAARNTALQLSQGDYIQWLDADDLLAPDKIAKQLTVENSRNRKMLLSSAWSRFYYRLSKAESMENSLWHTLQPVEWIIRKMRDNAWMAIESWLISRELVQAAGLWDTSLSADDDGEYVSRVVCACDQIIFVPQAASYVRQANLSSLSKSFYSRDRLESQFRSMTLQIGNVRKLEDSPRVRAACLQYLQRWLIYFYPEEEEIVTKARELAEKLGGQLEVPRLRWKYVPVQKAFGWTFAKKASFIAPKAKASCIKGWDRFLFKLLDHRESGSTDNAPA